MRRIFEDFLVWKGQDASDRTVRAYKDILARFDLFLAGEDPLRVSGDKLILFAGPYLHKQLQLAPVSRTPYVAAIREFYRWASAVCGLRPDNPSDAISYPKKSRRLPRVLSLESAERLMWAPDFGTFEGLRDATMLSILIGCGLRVSGLVRLNEGDIQQMTIEGTPRLALRALEKGDKERLVPIPREADLLLRVYLDHPQLGEVDRALEDGDKVLFITTMNRVCPAYEYFGERRRFSARSVLAMIKRYGERAGIPSDQLHPHAMRHLFGTELAEADIDLTERQQLMGHADPKSTVIYTHLAARKLVRGIDKGNPLAKIKTPMSQLLQEQLANVSKKPHS